jgi:glycosyltransferase involved in cell wall biosynthesis
MKDRLKVSLLVWNLSANDGIIRASLLSNALMKLNYEVEVLGFLFDQPLYTAVPSDLPIYSLEGGKYPDFFKPVAQLLNKIDGDFIYAIKPQPASFGLALLKKLFSRLPVILDIDDWELSWYGGDEWQYHPTPKQLARDLLKKEGALRRPDHPLYLQWMEKLISQADAVTVHTSFLQKRFGGIIVPNGKDISLFDPERYDPEISRTRFKLSGYRILMFPGAPRPYKGLEDVLVALDYLNEPDLRLVIVGGSPYDDYDQQLMQRWGHWIIQLPRCSVQMMPEIVSAAHIIVIPQRDSPETRAQFPLKLTDGMAMAKPILSTRVGDIPEILGDTGYLVDPSSPEQIAQKIKWIFQNLDAANAQGIQARKRCIEHYSIDTMAAILSDVLAELN